MAHHPSGVYREVDWQIVKRHARERWDHRAPDHLEGANLRAMWREATPVDFPSRRPSNYTRYHRQSGMVLVANYGFLDTVIPLVDRPQTTQEYVKQQL